MAVTEYYVDPGATVDTGSGTVGSPWGPRTGGKSAVQHALDTITQGANGDRINVKAGSTDTLNAALTLATYGTPTASQTLTIAGYTTAQGDGGQGVIDGASTYSIINAATLDYVHFSDMKLGNCGSAQPIVLDLWCSLTRCEVHTTSSNKMVTLDSYSQVVGCYFHTWTYGFSSGTAVTMSGSAQVFGNFFDCGTCGSKAVAVGAGSSIVRNVFKHDHVDALSLSWSSYSCLIAGNSSYNNSAGTSEAFYGSATNAAGTVIVDNIIEGWSSGTGINFSATANASTVIANNYFYNCSTDISAPNEGSWIDEGNTGLVASAFNDPTNDDFTASTEVKAGAFGQTVAGVSASTNVLDAGACQRLESGGGGGGIADLVGVGGGLISEC